MIWCFFFSNSRLIHYKCERGEDPRYHIVRAPTIHFWSWGYVKVLCILSNNCNEIPRFMLLSLSSSLYSLFHRLTKMHFLKHKAINNEIPFIPSNGCNEIPRFRLLFLSSSLSSLFHRLTKVHFLKHKAISNEIPFILSNNYNEIPRFMLVSLSSSLSSLFHQFTKVHFLKQKVNSNWH